MERGLILLAVTLMVFLAPGVHGTSHLTFDNTTEVNVTRAGCGTKKLCVETPDDCDPAKNNSCLFGSLQIMNTMAPNGSDLAVGLQGNSSGYVALGLAKDPSQGYTMVFVCGQNNSMFFFRTGQTNNSANSTAFMANERRVKDIRGLVNGSVIRCEFTVPSLNASSTKSVDHTFYVFLAIGDSATIGNINFILKAGRLNLADPASNIPTTTAPTTTQGMSGGAAFQPHAVLLLLGILICTAMQRV
ncbi:putative ferric-chelate reductase 1 [Myripristis murdjan]|uniref:putative ferric-chelate reductase 1 n=1 Tax=Myripristis murdjan TaxID=586833 RepID=UPI0011764875|nr:putative ferric-chelate reductase 1 [Myripristis murdjan]